MTLYKDFELYEALSELGVIDKDKLDDALKQSKAKSASLEDVLIEGDIIADENLGKVVSDLISTPFIRLSETAIDERTLKIIPEVFAKKRHVISFKKDKEGLHLAMADPSDLKTKEFIEKKVGDKVLVYYATRRDIEETLRLYAKDVKEVFEEIIEKNLKLAKGGVKVEPPIIKIVDVTIKYAYQNRASDIHIEPFDDKSLIRFRIDGILHDILDLPLELHPQVVTRIKVLADLRTDEHQSAQDGKISYKLEKEDLDIRVSIVPITNGEKIVMRILSERSRRFSLSDLGFSDEDLKKVETAYKKPHGMILATGPTGCGKTTSLYSILKLLNRRNVNIMTIEDPVEYDIEGVNQIQVNSKTDLTFAKGLRSIVRQDPDIILVGEIRDEETADISINAAMTGHLVLSTLHTNDAATTIPRLIDMKVEPFLIASTINLIIAQRLVRKICEKCRVSKEIDLSENLERSESGRVNSDNKRLDAEDGNPGFNTKTNGLMANLIKKYFKDSKARVYEGKGCSLCHNTGYLGRVGIFETLIVDDEIREAISQKRDADKIKELAVKNGMRTMIENGFEKVKSGITTFEEVLRVIKD